MLLLVFKKKINFLEKICYFVLLFIFLVYGENPNITINGESEYINIGNSSLEILFNSAFNNSDDEWKAVIDLFGTPWENSEIVGVYNAVSGDNITYNSSHFDNATAINLNYYKKMEIKYPLGSVKRLYAFQGCGFDTTILVNYSPMKIKTEYSLYLPFGFDIDPKENKGLTYLMSFIFLNIVYEVGNYTLNYGDYFSGLDNISISEHYTKITIVVHDSEAKESLSTLLDYIGINYSGNNIEKILTRKKELITTRRVFNSLLRLYSIYKSCLRDENYRIKYIRSGYILNNTSIGKSNSIIKYYNYSENDYYSYNNDLNHEYDENYTFHSECELFSDKWENYMNDISVNDISLYYSLRETELTEEEKGMLSPRIFEWIRELKELIIDYFLNYWKPEAMSLFIDSSINSKVFENIIGKKLATTNDCNCGFNYSDSVKFGVNNKNSHNNTDEMINIEHVNKGETEKYVNAFNIVPLNYKLSMLDIYFRIKMNNIVQMMSVTLTKVMDLVETLYVGTIKNWLKDEDLIRDLNVYWKLHYNTLDLSIYFRFKLNRKKLDKIINIVDGFRSFSVYVLGLIRKNGAGYEISKDLVELVDELQRLYEVRWHSQYIFDEEATILTTPLDICGIPTQIIKKNENIRSNWIKREVRLYNPILFKLYPNLLLHSIHRSYVKLPGELKEKNDCSLFRICNNEIVKEPLNTGSSIFLLLEYIIRKISEFKGTVILVDPYFRYKTKYEMKLETYNKHEYMNLHFNMYSVPVDLDIKTDNYERLSIENRKWKLPNSVVNLDSKIIIPMINKNGNLISNNNTEKRVNPTLMYSNSLGFAIKLDNFELQSSLVFIRSILRTKLDICDVYGYIENKDSICKSNNVIKKHSKLVLINILLLIINNSLIEFLENEPFEGYKDIFIKSFSTGNKIESKWRKKGTLSKPFHYGSLSFNINEIELNFVGPEYSILEYIEFIFENLINRFKPLSERDFYIILKELMKKEVKQRKNRSSIDFIRYYQGIFQYDNVFIDDIFIYTGIYTTYNDYLILFNYIMNNYFDSNIQYSERKIGYLETLVLGVENNSNLYREYTELIQKRLVYKEAFSYRYFCLRQENYMAFDANDEPIIIRQASSDRIMSTSSASIKFQLPCNSMGSKYNKYKLSSDFFFKNGYDYSISDGHMNEYYKWETNDEVEPRCIFNTVVSRVLERILRKHIKNIVNKVVEELVQDSNNDFIANRRSKFNIKGEVEVSFYKLNSIPQFTIYILSTNFDTFTLFSILKSTLVKLKTDVIENSIILTEKEFSSIKSYFIDYYCANDNIQIRNIRLTMIEMSRWRYNFNWKYESCNVAKELSRIDVINFFNDYFSSNSPYRRSFVLLVQGPPFKQLITTNFSKYKQNSLIKVYHSYIQSLLSKKQCNDKQEPNCNKKEHDDRYENRDKSQSLNIDVINNYSYPNELKTDNGILLFRDSELKRYQPRCPNFILDIFNANI
ncbi:hypothetical protein FG379_000842 [Cryptosporidium bovis]|uniref:uncharacterized protein n=1 Tax=Cryptosporidium bovis TaxID=310047 RepID=UPI00351A9AC9|nr:hypothetical protein FG379_000842 [Cryptosporidium bovis]